MSFSDGQYLTPHRRCTFLLLLLLLFDSDRTGWRQLLNLCSPVDGKPSVADLEDDPLADYILSGGPLRKLDDALQGSGFSFVAPLPPSVHRDHRLFIGGICAHPALW